MRACAVSALVLLAGPALAEDRWMSIPHPPAMPQAVASGMSPVNGIEMYYATYGAGDPVLLIHGGLGNADIWAYQVADLMKDYLVIVADSRGHGRSTRTEAPFGYDLMSEDYLALLDYLKIDKVDLVGWSDGGIIGLDIAMSHPERLDHLFAQAANITTDGVDPAVASNAVFGGYIGDGRGLRAALPHARPVRCLRHPDFRHVGQPAQLDRCAGGCDHRAHGHRRGRP